MSLSRSQSPSFRGESLESRRVLAAGLFPLAGFPDAVLDALMQAPVALPGQRSHTTVETQAPAVIGEEFLVNAPARGWQSAMTDSAVAANDAGRSVVAYSGRGPDDLLGVYVRIYDSQGDALGDPLRVNLMVRGDQAAPAVAMAEDGGFVVVWSGRGAGDHCGVFARWFSADGSPLTGEVLVHEYVAGGQHSPAVAMTPDGQTVIAYSGAGAGDLDGVFARRFSEDGAPLGPEQRVNASTRREQFEPDVAVNGDGEFVVAWTSRQAGGLELDVYAQRFDSSGQKKGAEFRVSQNSAGGQYQPTVGLADDGTMAVAWTHWSNMHDLEEVHARLFGDDGGPLGMEFQVHEESSGWQRGPTLAMTPGGDLVIGWSSGVFDGAGWEVMARQYDQQGGPQTGVFQVNRQTAGYASGSQSRLSATFVGNGDMLFVWAGRGRSDRRGVFGQRIDGEGEENRPPMLFPIDDLSVDEGQTVSFTAEAVDPDGDTLTWALDPETAPEGASIDPQTGEFTWTPSEAQGPGVYTITVLVTDNGSPPLVDSETFTITVLEVNRPPDLAPIADVNVTEGETVAFTATATDPDLPANTLTYSLDDGAPEGASIDPQTGEFTWTPSALQSPGVYTITVLVTDNGSPPLVDAESFTVTVARQNSPPMLSPIEDRSIDEGQTVEFTAEAVDPDGDTLTWALDPETAPEGASIDPQTGEFTWTPSEAQGPGVYTITVLATDDGSPALVDSETFTITVLEVNRPPDLAPIADVNVTEGETVAFTATATDPDLPANTLTYSLDDGAPEGASIDPQTGEFTWTPSASQSPGVYTITVLVTDNGSPPLVDAESFLVTVAAANRPPALAPIDDITVAQGEPVVFTAVAADPDPETTLTWQLDDSAPEGAVIDPATGEFAWTPGESQPPGNYSFSVLVTDDGAPPLVDSESFVIVVEAANRPPELAPIADRTATVGQTLSITAVASDPDGPADVLTYSLDDSAPAGAAIDPVSGEFTWTPGEEQAPGVFTIIVLVTDSGSPALVDSEEFTVTVESPPAAEGFRTAANDRQFSAVHEAHSSTFVRKHLLASDPGRRSGRLALGRLMWAFWVHGNEQQ